MKPEELAALAVRLGADVPFFLQGGTARVQGIGEVIRAVEGVPVMELVIVKPEAGLSTPAVFKAWHEKGEYLKSRIDAFLWYLIKGDQYNAAAVMYNDLEEPAMTLEPEVTRALEAQQPTGALVAMMTGSGTATLGWYRDAETAEKAQQTLSNSGWQAWHVQSVPHAMEITKL